MYSAHRPFLFGQSRTASLEVVLRSVYDCLFSDRSPIGFSKSFLGSVARWLWFNGATLVTPTAETRFLFCCTAIATILAASASAQSVSVSSPSDGTSVASPVH